MYAWPLSVSPFESTPMARDAHVGEAVVVDVANPGDIAVPCSATRRTR